MSKKLPESEVSESEPVEWTESEISKILRDTGHKLMKITVAIAKILTERDRGALS
jgi:hypothetical protein